ncbi:hypothetical protein NXV59_00025 [Bacteroides fragilis]|nr:hypothetical protein [Bacteroides fragilis]
MITEKKTFPSPTPLICGERYIETLPQRGHHRTGKHCILFCRGNAYKEKMPGQYPL